MPAWQHLSPRSQLLWSLEWEEGNAEIHLSCFRTWCFFPVSGIIQILLHVVIWSGNYSRREAKITFVAPSTRLKSDAVRPWRNIGSNPNTEVSHHDEGLREQNTQGLLCPHPLTTVLSISFSSQPLLVQYSNPCTVHIF